jgi:toxin YoeB
MRGVEFRPRAFEQMQDWLQKDRKLLQRILRMIHECQRTPFDGIGKPEPLKGELSGCWSRRINAEHRLVYEVIDELIIVLSMYGHYA